MCRVLAEEYVLGFETRQDVVDKATSPWSTWPGIWDPQGRLEVRSFFREQDSKAPM